MKFEPTWDSTALGPTYVFATHSAGYVRRNDDETRMCAFISSRSATHGYFQEVG